MGCCESSFDIETSPPHGPIRKKKPISNPFYIMNSSTEVEEECCICFEPMHRHVYLPCTHRLHSSCATQWFVSYGKRTCPICRVDIFSLPKEFNIEKEKPLEQETVQQSIVDHHMSEREQSTDSESFFDSDTSDDSDRDDTSQEEDSDGPAISVPYRMIDPRQEENLHNIVHGSRRRQSVRQAWVEAAE